MDRNWNWQGWVAIVLAGLALMVALGGRSSWGGRPQMTMMWSDGQSAQAVPAAPSAPQAPNAMPGGRGFGRGQSSQGFTPGQGNFRSGPMGRHSRPGIFGVFGMLFGLAKLAGLGLLAWLLFRMFAQRRNGTPPAPVQTTPAGHDPTIE